MKFAYPWLLALVPVVVLACHGFFLLADRWRDRRMVRFLGEAYPRYRERAGRKAIWIPQRYFLALCLAFLVAAAARPYLAPATSEKELRERVGADFMIAIDASKSMLARDVETTKGWRERAAGRKTAKLEGSVIKRGPGAGAKSMRQNRNLEKYHNPDSFSRLQAAKEAVRQLVNESHGDRIGLIAFTNEAALRAPLTHDFAALELVLESIGPATVPPGGTSIESAITRAQGIFKKSGIEKPILVILSDGEQQEGNALEAASKFRSELGGVIHTVGIGSPAGSKIQVDDGRQPFLRDQFGNTITTRLDKLGLSQIARATGGRYVDFGSDGEGLFDLYREQIKPQGDASPDDFPPNAIELYQIPLTFALLSLIFEVLVRAKAQPVRTSAIVTSP